MQADSGGCHAHRSRRSAKSSSATRTYGRHHKKSLPADRQSCFIASMIISLVNSKGGVGKSTLAGNLAGWLASHGRSVILADCDTQQSSSEWITEALPDIQVVCLANADAVLDELPSLAQEADFVIADGPGSQTETSRALLMWADLAILPCKASVSSSVGDTRSEPRDSCRGCCDCFGCNSSKCL